MHELGLAQALIEKVVEVALQEGASKVTSVRVVIGALCGVEREPFEFCFPLVAEGTVAEGASLVVDAEPLRVKCRACGEQTEPQMVDIRCVGCGSREIEVVAGRDFLVRSMEVR